MPNLLVKLKMEEKFTDYIENKKKICFVLQSHYKYRLGGAELQAYFIARELYRTGWEVHHVFDKSGILQREFDDGIVCMTGLNKIIPQYIKLFEGLSNRK